MTKTVFRSTLTCIEHFPTAFALISHNYMYVCIYKYIEINVGVESTLV